MASIQAHSRTRLNRSQRVIACLLLVAVVAFLVVNPLWECHDHLDNLRHLGPSGVLMIFLLFACAGITLFKSSCWFFLAGLGISRLNLQSLAPHRRNVPAIIRSVSFSDLPLPLRI